MSQKLRGIYDALDHGNYKNAVKLCSAFLQKQPNHALCKALHAVAVERCGRRDEALRLCDEAQDAKSGVDDTVLSTIQVVYRRCKEYARITNMYEAAWSKEPDNEDYAVTLFLSAIRGRDFVKCQQVASKLYKKFNKAKYLHWAIVCILLQVQAGGPAKVLDLAAMMLQKCPLSPNLRKEDGSNPFNRHQQYTLLLHLTTFRLQGKFDNALQLLDSFAHSLKLPSEILVMRAQLFSDSGKCEEAALEARKLVCQEPSSWSAMQDYIRYAFCCPGSLEDAQHASRELIPGKNIDVVDYCSRLVLKEENGEVLSLETLHDIETERTNDEVWNAFSIAKYLQKNESDSQRRIAHLAELEIWRIAFCLMEQRAKSCVSESGDSDLLQGFRWTAAIGENNMVAFSRRVEDYISRFGKKSHCFFDLKPFLCLLHTERVESVVAAQADITAKIGSKEALLNLARMKRAFQKPGHIPLEKMATDIDQVLEMWNSNRTDEEMSEGQAPHGLDDLLVLAIVMLVDMDQLHCWQQVNQENRPSDRSYLLMAVSLAEMGSALLPHSFNFRVLLVLLYGSLGLPAAMLRWYGTLDVKSIMFESLSFLVFDALCCFGCDNDMQELCKQISQFHDDMEKDSSDATSLAFHNGAFHRVQEYIQFMEHVNQSVVWGRVAVREMTSDLAEAQTWEALAERVVKNSALVNSVADKPPEYWKLRNQDRALLNGLHPLPPCSPLDAEMYSPGSWHDGFVVPTTLLKNCARRIASSVAQIWDRQVSKESTRSMRASRKEFKLSAVEKLLTQGVDEAPYDLKLSASLLQCVCALFQRDEAIEDQFLKALASAEEVLLVDGANAASITATAASTITNLQEGASRNQSTETLANTPRGFRKLCIKCAYASCVLVRFIMTSMSGKVTWDPPEKQLAVVCSMVHGLVECIRNSATSAPEGPFGLSLPGVPMLWAFLQDCILVVIPIVLWCCSTLPKAGSGKKTKEGQECLHASRNRLKSLLNIIQSGLNEISSELAKASTCETFAALAPDRIDDTSGIKPVVLGRLPDFTRHCDQVRCTMFDSHRKHLHALQDAVGARLALIKTRSNFKV